MDSESGTFATASAPLIRRSIQTANMPTVNMSAEIEALISGVVPDDVLLCRLGVQSSVCEDDFPLRTDRPHFTEFEARLLIEDERVLRKALELSGECRGSDSSEFESHCRFVYAYCNYFESLYTPGLLVMGALFTRGTQIKSVKLRCMALRRFISKYGFSLLPLQRIVEEQFDHVGTDKYTVDNVTNSITYRVFSAAIFRQHLRMVGVHPSPICVFKSERVSSSGRYHVDSDRRMHTVGPLTEGYESPSKSVRRVVSPNRNSLSLSPDFIHAGYPEPGNCMSETEQATSPEQCYDSDDLEDVPLGGKSMVSDDPRNPERLCVRTDSNTHPSEQCMQSRAAQDLHALAGNEAVVCDTLRQQCEFLDSFNKLLDDLMLFHYPFVAQHLHHLGIRILDILWNWLSTAFVSWCYGSPEDKRGGDGWSTCSPGVKLSHGAESIAALEACVQHIWRWMILVDDPNAIIALVVALLGAYASELCCCSTIEDVRRCLVKPMDYLTLKNTFASKLLEVGPSGRDWKNQRKTSLVAGIQSRPDAKTSTAMRWRLPEGVENLALYWWHEASLLGLRTPTSRISGIWIDWRCRGGATPKSLEPESYHILRIQPCEVATTLKTRVLLKAAVKDLKGLFVELLENTDVIRSVSEPSLGSGSLSSCTEKCAFDFECDPGEGMQSNGSSAEAEDFTTGASRGDVAAIENTRSASVHCCGCTSLSEWVRVLLSMRLGLRLLFPGVLNHMDSDEPLCETTRVPSKLRTELNASVICGRLMMMAKIMADESEFILFDCRTFEEVLTDGGRRILHALAVDGDLLENYGRSRHELGTTTRNSDKEAEEIEALLLCCELVRGKAVCVLGGSPAVTGSCATMISLLQQHHFPRICVVDGGWDALVGVLEERGLSQFLLSNDIGCRSNALSGAAGTLQSWGERARLTASRIISSSAGHKLTLSEKWRAAVEATRGVSKDMTKSIRGVAQSAAAAAASVAGSTSGGRVASAVSSPRRDESQVVRDLRSISSSINEDGAMSHVGRAVAREPSVVAAAEEDLKQQPVNVRAAAVSLLSSLLPDRGMSRVDRPMWCDDSRGGAASITGPDDADRKKGREKDMDSHSGVHTCGGGIAASESRVDATDSGDTMDSFHAYVTSKWGEAARRSSVKISSIGNTIKGFALASRNGLASAQFATAAEDSSTTIPTLNGIATAQTAQSESAVENNSIATGESGGDSRAGTEELLTDRSALDVCDPQRQQGQQRMGLGSSVFEIGGCESDDDGRDNSTSNLQFSNFESVGTGESRDMIFMMQRYQAFIEEIQSLEKGSLVNLLDIQRQIGDIQIFEVLKLRKGSKGRWKLLPMGEGWSVRGTLRWFVLTLNQLVVVNPYFRRHGSGSSESSDASCSTMHTVSSSTAKDDIHPVVDESHFSSESTFVKTEREVVHGGGWGAGWKSTLKSFHSFQEKAKDVFSNAYLDRRSSGARCSDQERGTTNSSFATITGIVNISHAGERESVASGSTENLEVLVKSNHRLNALQKATYDADDPQSLILTFKNGKQNQYRILAREPFMELVRTRLASLNIDFLVTRVAKDT